MAVFFSQEGEAVEFSLQKTEDGKTKATNVTGPLGAYVQGAPRQPRMYNDDRGFGGGGRGYGQGGRGGGNYDM